MSRRDTIALIPLLLPALGAVLLMVAIAIRRSHAFAAWTTVVTTAAGAVIALSSSGNAPGQVAGLLTFDRYSLFFIAAILASSAFAAAFAHGQLTIRSRQPEEFYVLLLTGTLGACVTAASSHFVSLFLGLELLSISLYAMLAYVTASPLSAEAAVKYLVLASTSAAILLFGMALAYFVTGSMRLEAQPPQVSAGDFALFTAGLILIIAGLAFKLALVPFHMWTADVYEGAPVPAAIFLATASKGAALAVIFRLIAAASPEPIARTTLAVIAALSILGGNLLALRQDDVKRLLGYSSIANMGYLIVPVVAGGAAGAAASAFYFAAYAATMLVAFGVLAQLESAPDRLTTSIDDIRGLFFTRPWLASALALAMLSLAGIPLTAGFIGKFLAIVAGASAALWALLIVLAIGTTIGLFYYLRVLIALFAQVPDTARRELPVPNLVGGIALAVLAIVVLWWGTAPGTLVNVVEALGR